MKIALAAVVLFCAGLVDPAPTNAQCVRGFCSPGVNVSVGGLFGPRVRVRSGLLGTRVRVGRQRANVQILNSSVPILNTSSVQFIPQPSFVTLGVGGFSGLNYGYGGYGSDDLALAARIRQEAAETAEIKSAVAELLGRLNEPVTAP